MKRLINHKLYLSIIFCHLAGVIGSLATGRSVGTWYTTLVKPSFTPPGWLFGPVWLLLYTFMGIALYLIWNSKPTPKRHDALVLFTIHLVLNALWSILFFGLGNLVGGLVDIVLMWFTIIYLIKYFKAIDKHAAWLMVPYLFWVTFALILNWGIVVLN